MPPIPLARADVLLEEIGDEVIAYDPGTQRAHLLNGAAAALFLLCSGASDADELVMLVAETIGQSAEEVRGEVERMLERFAAEGLLQPGST